MTDETIAIHDADASTLTERELWTQADGWRLIGGVRLLRPDPENARLWLRCKVRVDGLWQRRDIALDWQMVKEWMGEREEM